MKSLSSLPLIAVLSISCSTHSCETLVEPCVEIGCEELARQGLIFRLDTPGDNRKNVDPETQISVSYYDDYFDDCDNIDPHSCFYHRRIFEDIKEDLKITGPYGEDITYQIATSSSDLDSFGASIGYVILFPDKPLAEGPHNVRIRNIKNDVISSFDFSVGVPPQIKRVVIKSDQDGLFTEAVVTFSEPVQARSESVCFKDICNEEGCDHCDEITVYGDGVAEIGMPVVSVSALIRDRLYNVLSSGDASDISGGEHHLLITNFSAAADMQGVYYWGAP